MKKYVYIIVLIWALLAGGITAYNENLLRKGEEILLKVSPVDLVISYAEIMSA